MKKILILLVALTCSLMTVQAGGIETLLNYVQQKSDIRESGSSVYNYEGLTYVVSVAAVTVGTKTELNCKTVGAAKAKKEMIAFVNGSEISSYTELKNSETETETLEGTKVEAKQESTEVIREHVLGMINQTVPLGGWYSDDKGVYYYAIYKIVE